MNSPFFFSVILLNSLYFGKEKKKKKKEKGSLLLNYPESPPLRLKSFAFAPISVCIPAHGDSGKGSKTVFPAARLSVPFPAAAKVLSRPFRSSLGIKSLTRVPPLSQQGSMRRPGRVDSPSLPFVRRRFTSLFQLPSLPLVGVIASNSPSRATAISFTFHHWAFFSFGHFLFFQLSLNKGFFGKEEVFRSLFALRG